MKKQLLVLLVITGCFSVNAQQLEVVASSGDFHQNSSGSLSWTLGEVAGETLIGTNFIFTQGFQQSKLTVTAVENLQFPDIEITIYPNPTNNFIFIEVNTEKQVNLHLKLYDLYGKLILLKQMTGRKQNIQMQNYKPAVYILKVFKDGKAIKTYQVVKQ